MHPLGQVVKVLTVTLPLQPVVERFIQPALRKRLADSQAAARQVGLSFLLTESTDPALAWIVTSMSPERVMNLIDQAQREIEIGGLPRVLRETEQIAYGERIGPQIAPASVPGTQASAFGE